jgi:hypothetical protein
MSTQITQRQEDKRTFYQLLKSLLQWKPDKAGKSWLIRESAVENPHASDKVLEISAKDKDWLIRRKVTEHPKTPYSIMAQLAKDRHWLVRAGVAEHTKSADMLAMLAEDEHASVRVHVVDNSATSDDTLAKKLAHDSNYLIRKEANMIIRRRAADKAASHAPQKATPSAALSAALKSSPAPTYDQSRQQHYAIHR